ncbi:hypothetical protein [Parasitella parasitica]|uniref:Uncharacterized protein n=1 Tax=Parasitella parasitica TaxID=35722 RepID=A0A0B7NGA8_9FUNG|nr:hypothetical protein [Parasitella parasitica]
MVVELADANGYFKMGELPDKRDSGMEGVTVTVLSPLQAANNEVPLYAADEPDDEPSDDESVQVDDTVEDKDQEASRICLIDTKYKTSGVAKNGSDEVVCVYDWTSFENVGPNSYTKSELISTELKNSNKPFQTMKIMSIGDIISHLIADSVPRRELRYRHNLDADHHDDEQPDDEMERISPRICIPNDGFVIDKRGSRLFTITYVLLLNYRPKKEPASFSSCLSVILADIQWLSTHGMVVNTPNNLSICLRVHCLVAGGDIPAVFDWSRCVYHSSEYGCRICYSKVVNPENRPQGLYFPDTDAAMRTREDYREANSILGYNGRCLFTDTSITNSRPLDKQNKVLPQALKDIGKQIEKTRSFIPVAFDGAFQDIVQKIRGTRAYIVPTLFIPKMTNTQVAKAIMRLTRGISLSLYWESTERTLNENDACFRFFHNYCKRKISDKQLSVSIL